MKLSEKQKTFVDEYLKDLNATQAAIRAGYSQKTAYSVGHENLRKPEIQKTVEEAMKRRSERTEVTQDRVVDELRKIAFVDMGKIVQWNASGVTYKDSADFPEEAKAAIQSVEESTNAHGGTIKIKLYDKIRALELLGKHLAMFDGKAPEKFDESLPYEEWSDEELKKKWVELKNKESEGSEK